MKTTITSYNYDTRTESGAAAYKALCEQMKENGVKCFETHGGRSHYLPFAKDGATVELESSSLFYNQWNTAPIAGVSDKGLRVFDWAQDYQHERGMKHIKRGHWLTITPEMREIRRNTLKCRYCGAMEPAQKGYVFCPHCIDSQYLDAKSLKLTRMMPVDDKSDCPELTEAEKAHLLPIWKKAQIEGSTKRGIARIARARADAIKKRDAAIRTANVEFAGFNWLMEHGIDPSIAIYYSHTGRFGFGWTRPVEHELLSTLLESISEFPFPYDIKCADGRTLSGER